MGGVHRVNRWYRTVGKRCGDLALAILGAGLLWPVAAWVGGIITLTSPGPALLGQPRLGRRGRRFTLWKFRSMVGSQRVTATGRWLRVTALDELPQLLNILRGEMSFVGPRPLLLEDARAVAAVPGGQLRASLVPGLAGLAQLASGKHPAPSTRLAMDRLYASRCRLGLDLWILCQAVATSVHGRWDRPVG